MNRGNVKQVFLFWIGDESKILSIKEKLEKQGFNIQIGPKATDHEYLYSNYPYYRKAFDQKIWALCSDVWRAYKLSKEKGVYIDTSVEIGNDFPKFYEYHIQNDVSLFRENKKLISNSIMFSGIENNYFFTSLLKLYGLEIPFDVDVRFLPFGPSILSAFIIKECGKINGLQNEVLSLGKTKVRLSTLLEIRNASTIVKKGSGSWFSNGTEVDRKNAANQYWENLEKNWKKRSHKLNKKDRATLLFAKRSNFPILVWPIRNGYDNAMTRTERARFVALYKKIDYRKKITELLFWSRLNFIFTFKWLKNSK